MSDWFLCPRCGLWSHSDACDGGDFPHDPCEAHDMGPGRREFRDFEGPPGVAIATSHGFYAIASDVGSDALGGPRWRG